MLHSVVRDGRVSKQRGGRCVAADVRGFVQGRVVHVVWGREAAGGAAHTALPAGPLQLLVGGPLLRRRAQSEVLGAAQWVEEGSLRGARGPAIRTHPRMTGDVALICCRVVHHLPCPCDCVCSGSVGPSGAGQRAQLTTMQLHHCFDLRSIPNMLASYL